MAMTDAARDPLAQFARSLPAAFDESALHELADRLQPFLAKTEASDDDRRLYTSAEAAKLVGVNIETVRRAIRSSELRVAGRIGRSPRLSREAIDGWLSSTIELTEPGPRRRPRRRRSVLPEHSLRTAFNDP
jgi:excisionase family DNA binding protein